MSKDSKLTDIYQIKVRLDECNYQIHQIEVETGLTLSKLEAKEDGYSFPEYGIIDSLGGRFYDQLWLCRYDSRSVDDHCRGIKKAIGSLRECYAARKKYLDMFQDSWEHLPAYDPDIQVEYGLRKAVLMVPIELLVKYQVHLETKDFAFESRTEMQRVRGCYIATTEFTWCELAWEDFDRKVNLLSWKIDEYQKKGARKEFEQFNAQCRYFDHLERAIFEKQEPIPFVRPTSNTSKLSGDYTILLKHPVLQRPGVTYFSSRAADGENCLLVQCSDNQLELKLQELYERDQCMRREYDISTPCECIEHCIGQRGCARISFLPTISAAHSTVGRHYLLKYSCFQLGEMVRMRDLAETKYVSVLTAYRLTVSLLTLVDQLIRMKVLLRLSVGNLLVDLKTSFVLPIDWSRAKPLDYMPMQLVLIYYRQVARIIMKLTGAYSRNGENWKFPFEHDPGYGLWLNSLFTLLQKQLDCEIKLSENLDEAMEKASEFYTKKQQFIAKLSDYMRDAKVEPGKPLYELFDREEQSSESTKKMAEI